MGLLQLLGRVTHLVAVKSHQPSERPVQRVLAVQMPLTAASGVHFIKITFLVFATLRSVLAFVVERQLYQQVSDKGWHSASATFNDPSATFVNNFTKG